MSDRKGVDPNEWYSKNIIYYIRFCEMDRHNRKNRWSMEETMSNLSEFNHNHHSFVVDLLAKYFRRGIWAEKS